jgi:hypothetical protein
MPIAYIYSLIIILTGFFNRFAGYNETIEKIRRLRRTANHLTAVQ